MQQFKRGDKVVAASQKGSKLWIGLEVTHDYGGVYECIVTDKASAGYREVGAFDADDLSIVKPKAKRDYIADHARRSLRKLGLTKEEAAKAVKYIPRDRLSQMSRKAVLQDVCGEFVFESTAEGGRYWRAVMGRIDPAGGWVVG